MHGILQKAGGVLGGVVLLFPVTVLSGAPEGHPESIDYELRQELRNILRHEGYRSTSTSVRDSEITVSAYLWDHRERLTTTNFPREQQTDALVCLLREKYNSLDRFLGSASFNEWCRQTVKRGY